MQTQSKKKLAIDYMPHSDIEIRILHKRAIQMAKQSIKKLDTEHLTQYICFKLGSQERYGVPYQYTKEVMRHIVVATLPFVPDYISGVINRRGVFISVLDLKYFFHIEDKSVNKNSYIIVVSGNGITVGLLVDGIVGSDVYDISTLDPAVPSHGIIHPEYILGLHKGKVAMLNMEAVMAAPFINYKNI